jgi:hypothetical protein
MAECDEAASPGVGTYAKAAGTGLFTRLATPFVALAAALKIVADIPPPTTPDDTKARLATAAVFGGIGTAVGIVAGPFIATREATKTVRDKSQQLFERCLVARGYRPPPTGIPAPRVLLLVEHKRTPATAVEAFRRELERRGYVFGTTLEVDVQWWDGPRASAGVFVTPWDVVVAPSGEAASAAQRVLPRVPVVVAGSDIDLVAAGLADSLSEPRRNVTGLSLIADELNESRLQLLLTALPHVKRVAILTHPDNAGHGAALDALARVAPSVTLRRVDVRADTDLERLFRELSGDGIEGSSCCRIDACGDTGTRWRRSRSANGCRPSPARSASVMPAACSSFIRPSTAPGARRRHSWTAFSRVRRWDRCRSPRWPNATWS